MDNGWYMLGSAKLSAVVHVQDDKIDRIWSPIARKFLGQPVQNMIGWLDKQGELHVAPFNAPKEWK